MGFLTSVSGFFKRDKSTQIAKQAKGISVADPNVRFGNGIMAGSDGNSMGMRGLSAALNMDQDLMMRYADMENMDDYPELNCLAGDSIIFTLKDGWITIRELADRGGSFYVLSYDKELKSIVPSLCEGALCTYPEGHSKQMVVVTMDNGQTLKCTADHRFMLKGEKWVKAEDLKLNDRLMPGYLRLRNPGEGQHGYWQLHQPSEASLIRASDGKRWTWVHRLVGELMLGATKGDIVHHKDNTLNNDPDAISIEDLVTHATIHLAPIDNTKYFPAWTTEMRVKMAERMRGNTYSKGRTLSEETRRKMSVVRKGKAKNKEWRERIGNSQPNKINLNRQEVEAAFLEVGTIAGVAKKLGVSWPKAKRYIAKNDIKNEYANHRVLNVRYIDSKEALYDLQVSKYENFVCNGVVVHNSALDIFSDDCTVTDNVRGKTIWTESKDKVIRDIVDDLLHRRLRIEEDVWSIIRSLNKYGNAYAELIIIPGQGIVGINPLPVATMRRIVDIRGATLGYMQDMTGQFAFHMANVQNIKQLKQALKEREVIFFEPWEVVHWRLSSKHIRSIYGFGILESARWVFKRLVMLEDTMLLYRLCLRGDTKVWVPGGTKMIRDLNENDDVFYYGEDGKLNKTRVVYKKNNGDDRVYRVKSLHRDLYANATHPILVETITKHGSGTPREHKFEYVEVRNIVPGKHRFVTPVIEDDTIDNIELKLPAIKQRARLSQRAIDNGIKLNEKSTQLQARCGMVYYRIDRFFKGEYEVVADTARKLMIENGTPGDEWLDLRDDWGGCKEVNTPKYVNKDFARLFGFMLGDGFLSQMNDRNGQRKVGFAAGNNNDINEKYKNLFEKFFGKLQFNRDKRSKYACVGAYSVCSKQLHEFFVLNGFIPGAHNKRVPEWVFRSSVLIRDAFLKGFADADGHYIEGSIGSVHKKVRHVRVNIEICNKMLAEDLFELAMQIGYRMERMVCRNRKGGSQILNNGFTMSDRQSYCFAWSYDRQPITEPIMSIDQVENDDVWDIGVEASEHNFIANGVVVHNSRSPGRFAFYVDTGDLPPAEAMAQVKRVKQSYKKRTLLNPTTGQLEFRNNPMCLAGDTVVRLEDGRLLSILEIVEEYEAGKVNAVYSYDIEKKNRKVMPITWAGKTREHAAMVKVTLENGNSIYCTPDHEFPLYEGGKCKAQDLNGKNLVALNLDPEKVFDVCEWGPAEQTYTLTINGTHTFGLKAGVFTCNSPEEDIFIPTRGGKESTRVEILSGPDWSVNDDLEYLRDKLFTSIKIPRAYYGGDADASQSLAQKDVRFARTCLRIQREFRNGIRHIARIHMAALGIDPDSTEWDTRMTAPSSILELQQIETMNAQAGLISALENKLPLDWMLQRIMHLSQDDAATVMLKKDDEIANNAEAQAKLAFDLQKKYPGVDTSQLGEPSALPMGQGQDQGQQQGQAQQGQPSENINKKIDNINLLLKENIQCQRQVVKKIEEMGPIAKLVKRAYRGRNSKNANN